ncbi:MAG TPA: hypothetical protein PKW80_12335 [Bacteroidales bacterium]|nr:hypothetical protein [Bacteroidales bacterium]
MKYVIVVLTIVGSCILLSGCNKTACDNCALQKREYCIMMMQANCNSALLTEYTINVVDACGQEAASNYISVTTDSCINGTLICPEEDEDCQ